MSDTKQCDYIKERIDKQIEYFDSSAVKNQKRYKFLKSAAILCNILTTMTIALAFVVPEILKISMGILALILSTFVLATYQWEEFFNYGAKWEKFRLVAEEIKSEKWLYLNNAGRYYNKNPEECKKLLVEIIEEILRGTDFSYFSIMVEPGKGMQERMKPIEKR
jgi:hypothetical protein